MADFANLIIKVDSNGVVTASRELDKMSLSGDKAEQSTGKLTDSIGAMVAKAAAITAAIMTVVKLTESFVAAEKAATKLESAVRATGQSMNTYGLRQYASALQQVSEFGDDATTSAAAMLIQLAQLTESGVKKALPLVQDFASAMGMDLESAAQLVSKALADNEGALSRYGVKVEEGKTKQEQFNNVLKALEERFGGMAKAVGNTTGGHLTQFANAIDDLKENGGALIATFLDPATTALTRIVEKMNAAASSWVTFNNTMRTHELESSLEGLEEQKKALENYLKLFEKPETVGQAFQNGIRLILRGLSGNLLRDVFVNTPGQASGLLEEVNKAIYWTKQQIRTGGEKIDLGDLLGGDDPTGTGKVWTAGTWQDWFEKITGVPAGAFGESGSRAAELFLSGFSQQVIAGKQVAESLGEAFDPVPYLEAEAETIRKALTDLLAINPAVIDKAFTTSDSSIAALTGRLRELEAELAKLRGFNEEPQDWPAPVVEHDPEELYPRASLEHVLEIARRLREEAEAARAPLLAFKGVMEDIGVAVGNLAMSSAIDAFKEIGEAIYDGTMSAETFGQAIGKMVLNILNALPMLFLSAGLNLLATNPSMWPVALGLIAAAGITAVGSGIAAGYLGSESARGNVFSGGELLPFAAGGLVTRPTVFPMANGGLGLMGEAGPEAIMPLARTADGNLGVRSSGAGGVTVTVNNYSGAPVQQRERRGPGGSREIEILVGAAVQKQIANGTMDKTMAATYGLSRRGRS